MQNVVLVVRLAVITHTVIPCTCAKYGWQKLHNFHHGHRRIQLGEWTNHNLNIQNKACQCPKTKKSLKMTLYHLGMPAQHRVIFLPS